MPTLTKRILGIDPGYDRVGVAVLEKQSRQEVVLFSDCLLAGAKLEFAERLVTIGNQVEKIIKKWQPDILAIEKLFFAANQKTAMRVAETRGMIIYLGQKHSLRVREFTPLQVKMSVSGYGRADKKQVTEMVCRLTKMEKKPRYDDEYDAVAVALTCLAHGRFQ